MNTATRERARKERSPELYCQVRGCLWRIQTAKGASPCMQHPVPESFDPAANKAAIARLNASLPASLPYVSGHDAMVSYDEPGAHGWMCQECSRRTLNDDGMCVFCDASDIAAREGEWPTALDVVTRHTAAALQLFTLAKDLHGAERANAMRLGRAEGRHADNLLAAVLL